MTDTPTPRGICDAIRAATTEQALAEAWIGSRSRRLEMSMIDRVRAIEAYIDAFCNLGDDGR